MHTLTRLDSFEPGRPGGLTAYLRRGIINRICDEIRRVSRRPQSCELTDRPDVAPSALELMIGKEVVERYEAAFARLSAGDRTAITARLEDHQS
jgi:DNA-directed RNA polymerase specialized sigma24 family protein